MSLLRRRGCCCGGCLAARCQAEGLPGGIGNTLRFCGSGSPVTANRDPTPVRWRVRITGINWASFVDCGTGEEAAGQVTITGTPPEEICVELLAEDVESFSGGQRIRKSVTLPITIAFADGTADNSSSTLYVEFIDASPGRFIRAYTATTNKFGDPFEVFGSDSLNDPGVDPRFCCVETTWENTRTTDTHPIGCDPENFPEINIANSGTMIVTPCAECNPLP